MEITNLKDLIFVHTKKYLDNHTTPKGVACSYHQICAVADQVFEQFRMSKTQMTSSLNLQTRDYTHLNQILEKIVINSKSPWKPKLDLSENPHQQMLYNIMRGDLSKSDEIYKDFKLLQAVVYKKDEQVLANALELVEKIFEDISRTTQQTPPLSEEENFHMEMIIGDILALVPFLSPMNGNTLIVPTQVIENNNKIWKNFEYTIEEIRLTPTWMGSPVTAFGLKCEDAPPLLLYKGTTYPTDSGFALSLLTDLNPLGSAGSYVFHMGKSNIKKWLDTQTIKHKAIVIGKSLGGIESFLTAIEFPDQVAKVMAYGAPGLAWIDLSKLNNLRKNREEQHTHFPEIHAFCQKNDSVPYCDGMALKGVHYYQVIGSSSATGVLAHAEMSSLHHNSMILKLDPNSKIHRTKRIALTFFRTFLSFSAFPFLALIYIAYKLVDSTAQSIKKLPNSLKPNRHLAQIVPI